MKTTSYLLLCLLSPLLGWAQQANVNLDYNPQKNTENLTPFSAPLNSPDVRDDGTVTFRLRAPAAKEVRLVGAVLTALGRSGQPMPFTKGGDGIWTLTIGPLKPDMYAYHLNVDGVQMADPNNTCAAFTAMPPYSQLVVHGSGPSYYDARNVPHGNVTRHVYHSDVTSGERELYVYTPPGFDRARTYPVLYLVGGSGELPSNWIFDGRANFILDNLLAEKKAAPMLIVIPNNQVVHRNHPKHVELTFKVFEAELRQHVIPLVEREYNVHRDPKGRALAGLSMGGRHAMFVGFNSLDLFASFGVLSAGDVESEKSFSKFLNDPDLPKKVDYLFVGQGTLEAESRMGERCVALHQALENHKIEHEYYVGGHGGHDWATWRHLLYYRFLPNLWRKQSRAEPSAVTPAHDTSSSVKVAQEKKPDPKFHIYLCFGQSNMEAGARPEAQDRGEVDPRFQMLAAVDMPRLNRSKGHWYVATPPLNRQENNMGPVDWFGRNMAASLPQEVRVGVINVSVAGAGIELWDKENWEKYLDTREQWMRNIVNQYNGSPYQRLVEMARIAQTDGVIKGILLHQGESNSSDTNWPAKVKRIYDNLMMDLDLNPKDVPLLAGELKSEEEHGVCFRFNTNILARLPEVFPNSYIISSKGVKGTPDQFHFNTAGMRELGKRYAIQMLKLEGVEFKEVERPGLLPASATQPTGQPATHDPRS